MSRRATVTRQTRETSIHLELDLDGDGTATISTGIPFFDHMLEQVARHGLYDLRIEARGDLEVDAHHTVEDTAIVLGQAFDQALGSRRGIGRFGFMRCPLDEAAAEVSVDFGGRPYLVFHPGPLERRRGEVLGGLPVDLVDHIFQSFASAAKANVHARLLYGENLHHLVEALFKAFARACRMATDPDPRQSGVPSTKGTLEG